MMCVSLSYLNLSATHDDIVDFLEQYFTNKWISLNEYSIIFEFSKKCVIRTQRVDKHPQHIGNYSFVLCELCTKSSRMSYDFEC